MFLLTLGLINLLWLYLHLWSSSQPTNAGERYFISIIDDHTRFVRLYVLHTKSQTTNVFLPFKQMLENYLIALLRPYKQMIEESLCLWLPCWKRMVYCIDAHVPILVKKTIWSVDVIELGRVDLLCILKLACVFLLGHMHLSSFLPNRLPTKDRNGQ